MVIMLMMNMMIDGMHVDYRGQVAGASHVACRGRSSDAQHVACTDYITTCWVTPRIGTTHMLSI